MQEMVETFALTVHLPTHSLSLLEISLPQGEVRSEIRRRFI